MLQHLDDPHGFAADERLLADVQAAAQSRRRRRNGALLTVAALPLVVLVGLGAYLQRQADELQRVEVEGLVPAGPTPDVAGPGQPVEPLTSAVWMLLVGTDARGPDDDGFGLVEGARADAIMVVRIDPEHGRLGLLSLPRDLWVPTPQGDQRLSAVLAEGGPSRFVEVLSAVTGVGFQHYVQVEFAGFRRLVDLAGGVTVSFDGPVRDPSSGFSADGGCVHLDGDSALAYVRSRQLEAFDPTTGRWVSDPTSDLGRQARQRDVAAHLAGTVLTAPYSLAEEVRLLTDVLEHVTVDQHLDLGQLRSLFATARQIGPDGLGVAHLEVTPEVVDEQSVLAASPEAMAAAVESLTDPGPPPGEEAAQGSMLTAGAC